MIEVNIDCAYDELVPLKKLKPHPKNSNKHSHEQIVRLAEIIEYQGMRSPIVVSRLSGYITKGHGRLAALKRLGLEKAPVNYQDYTDEAQEFTDLTADNEIARWAELDMDKIIENADLLEGMDLNMLGIQDLDIPEFEDIMGERKEKERQAAEEESEEEVPILRSKSKVRKGDVWLLGKHRLMCGDSTSSEEVKKLMNNKKADMVHTDPPYGVDYEGVNNDHLKADALYEFILKALKNSWENSRGGANIYVWHPDIHAFEFIKAFRDAGFNQARPSTIQWVKDSLVLSQGDYHSQNEPCLYGWKKGEGRVRVEDRKQTTIWNFPKPKRSEAHPTMKPLGLCERAIQNSSSKGMIVLDLFLGSGSTLIASDNLGRVCYGMELDENYCEVIIKRWENLTGLKATLESNGKTYDQLRRK